MKENMLLVTRKLQKKSNGDFKPVSYTHLDVYKRQGAYISQMGTKWNLQLDEHAQNIREKLWKEQKKHMIMNM